MAASLWLWLRLDRDEVAVKKTELPEPEFSVPSRAFESPFLVELANPSGGGEIRYTLGGS